jgi:Domain of unknown function (DUF4214)
MFSVTRRGVVYRFCLVVMLLALVLPGLTPLGMPGRVVFADPTTPRSYAEFINNAYMGALGRPANCTEAQAEYDALVSAASAGTLNREARRFVSTLFETQTSYFTPNLTTYCQTPEYEALNPASCNPLIGTGLGNFLTDLYQAFLQREPDISGFNFWMNNNNGRKHLILAFEDSGDFTTLVSNLFQGTRPSCPGPRCDVTVNPDPLFLVSFGFFVLDSGTMRAETGPFPCVFIADQAVLEDPISAFPTTPLLLPVDEWFVFDNGALIPFSGFTAVGSIGFLAFNGQDFTAKEGTIFLTVFDAFSGGGGEVTQSAVMGVPVTGEYTTTKKHPDDKSSTQTASRPFFRDRNGRIRIERGDIVTITDPSAGVRYVLNTKDKTAYRITLNTGARNTASAEPLTSNMAALKESRSLGTQRIEDVEAAGKEYTSVIPAGSKLGNSDPVQATYQIWLSKGLQLPLLVKMQDTLNGETSIQFKRLQKAAEPDPQLFAVPEGYRVIDAKPVTQRGQAF